MSTTTKATLVVLAIGVAISLFVWKCTAPKVPVIPIVHDTVVKKYFIFDTIKGSKIEIPTKVVEYDTSFIRDTSLHVISIHDTTFLVKHDTIQQTFDPVFLSAFPKSPKLILGEFSQNNISLSLLGTDGVVIGKQYTPDYTKYNYEFSGSELKFYPLANTTGIQGIINNFTTESYMTTTYNIFTHGATMKLEYNLMYKRIGGTIFGSFSTDQTPMFNSGIGLRVKIK